MTPTASAARSAHWGAEYLIGKGADVNAKSPSGATPLGLAIAANYHTLAAMLRTHGGR